MDFRKLVTNDIALSILLCMGIFWLPFLSTLNLTIQVRYILDWPSYLIMSLIFLAITYKLSNKKNIKINTLYVLIILFIFTLVSYTRHYSTFNYLIPILTLICLILLVLESPAKLFFSYLLLFILFGVFFCGIFAPLPTYIYLFIYLSTFTDIDFGVLYLYVANLTTYFLVYSPSVVIAVINIVNSKPNKQFKTDK
jgi:hypothetical protein